jgi:glutathione S-transferase
MDIKLYYAPGACSMASHICLEELGLPYDTQRLNLANGDQRKPEYLALNPRGRVPTAVVDGKVLTENVGIMSYFGGGYGQGKVWPKDTWHQATLVSTMAWLSNTVHPTHSRLFRPERFAEGADAQQAVKAKSRELLEGYLREIDGLLAGRKWAIGNHYTVADGYLLVFYRWGNRQGMPVKSLPNYTRLMNEVMGRPAVAKVMADEGVTLD